MRSLQTQERPGEAVEAPHHPPIREQPAQVPPPAAADPGLLRRKVAGIRNEMRVPLYRNAYALMLNTIVNSVLGTLYWIVAARRYSAADVGRDSALISLMMLVSVLTQLNFGQALIRFLPRANTAGRRLLVASYAISAAIALVVMSIVVVVAHVVISPRGSLHLPLLMGVWFVASTVGWSIFNLQDSALTGLRSAMAIPLENGLFGVVKLVCLVMFAVLPIGYGVYLSWTLPVVLFVIPVNLYIFLRVLPRHKRDATPDEKPIKPSELSRYMAGDYVGAVLTQMSSTFLPVLVVALLGKEQGAYFYVAQTISTAMILLSMGLTSSLIVEASKDESRAHHFALAMLRRILVTVLPAATIVVVTAPLLLSLYGPQYRSNATLLLQLLVVSIVPRTVVSLYSTKARLANQTGRLAILQLIQAAILIVGVVMFAPSSGLQAVGWMSLVSQAIPAIVLTPAVIRWLRPNTTSRHLGTTPS